MARRRVSVQQRPRSKVLIVDDHPAVREALSIRISQAPDLEACGQAADVGEALRLVGETKPDIAIIDISLKTGDGIDLIKRIKKHTPTSGCWCGPCTARSCTPNGPVRARAHGYITKEHATDRIIDAIREVLADNVYFSPAMTKKLLTRSLGRRQQDDSRPPVEMLSDRELEVFRLIGRGVKTADIATQLHLSVRTVWTYRDRIREKLGLNDAADWSATPLIWVLENE